MRSIQGRPLYVLMVYMCEVFCGHLSVVESLPDAH